MRLMVSLVNYPRFRLRYTWGFRTQGGMPQDGLASTFWSYFPSYGRDGRSIHL